MLIFRLWAHSYFPFGRPPTLASQHCFIFVSFSLYLCALRCSLVILTSCLSQMSSLFKWWQAAREWKSRKNSEFTATTITLRGHLQRAWSWLPSSTTGMFSPVCRRVTKILVHTSGQSVERVLLTDSREKNVMGKYWRSGQQRANPRHPTNRSSDMYVLHCHPTARGDVHWNACLFWKELRAFLFLHGLS